MLKSLKIIDILKKKITWRFDKFSHDIFRDSFFAVYISNFQRALFDFTVVKFWQWENVFFVFFLIIIDFLLNFLIGTLRLNNISGFLS